jgi:hypothetical protein
MKLLTLSYPSALCFAPGRPAAQFFDPWERHERRNLMTPAIIFWHTTSILISLLRPSGVLMDARRV